MGARGHFPLSFSAGPSLSPLSPGSGCKVPHSLQKCWAGQGWEHLQAGEQPRSSAGGGGRSGRFLPEPELEQGGGLGLGGLK